MTAPTRIQVLQTALGRARAQLAAAEAEVEEMRTNVYMLAGRLAEASEYPAPEATKPAAEPATGATWAVKAPGGV